VKFVLLFRGGGPQDDPESSPEHWARWIGDLTRRGLVDSGSPLEERGTIVRASGTSDYLGTDDDVGGFLVLEAGSLDEAAQIARTAPNVRVGGAVEVRPLAATLEE
jgi:hypothetical protein